MYGAEMEYNQECHIQEKFQLLLDILVMEELLIYGMTILDMG